MAVQSDAVRSIGTSRDWAEAGARDWLQRRGFDDVAPASTNEHRAASLKGRDVAAQVKFSNAKVGLQEVRDLQALLVATDRTKGFFFSVAGYTDEAAAWADEMGVMLLRLVLDARPANDAARRWSQPGATPSVPIEQLERGDTVDVGDGSVRTVKDIHTRRERKQLQFFVVLDDGRELAFVLGDKVPLAP